MVFIIYNLFLIGKDWGKRRRGQQRMRWLDSIPNSMATLGDSEGQGSLACSSPCGHKESETWLSDWTEQNIHKLINLKTAKRIEPISWFSFEIFVWGTKMQLALTLSEYCHRALHLLEICWPPTPGHLWAKTGTSQLCSNWLEKGTSAGGSGRHPQLDSWLMKSRFH